MPRAKPRAGLWQIRQDHRYRRLLRRGFFPEWPSISFFFFRSSIHHRKNWRLAGEKKKKTRNHSVPAPAFDPLADPTYGRHDSAVTIWRKNPTTYHETLER